jgi:uncharacterized protein (DUF1501 family)
VQGGKMYGTFPPMTNYANFNATNDDYADNRGAMLPGVSLSQYGATLAKWFGAADADVDRLFPTLANFTTRDRGFMSYAICLLAKFNRRAIVGLCPVEAQ